MCELDVTAIVASIAPRDYSASVAELGNDAGRITWEAACEDARGLFGEAFDRESFDYTASAWQSGGAFAILRHA